MSKPLEAVLVGAGNRGYDAYGPYSLQHPHEVRFVAVAEPHEERRARFARAHNIPPARQFRTWQEMLAQGQIADAALVCTLDRMHVEPAVAALETSYDVLLEKPMATTVEDCVRLVHTAERTGRILMICHVLRYTAFFSGVHEIIASGRLGDVITVEHRENVVYWHMAHSFVRGNWRNSRIESPMILAKCCHDMDILFWNLGPVKRLNSFGSLIHYRPENAPPGATERCTDGCPVADDCPFYAPRPYLSDHTGWPASVISEDLSLEARRRVLETGPYGRCVYRCDNDVVDHQTVNMEFESGVTGVLFMHGHSHEEGRTMRYDGTRATLRGRFTMVKSEITIHDHLTGGTETIVPKGTLYGHGGGDEGLMAAFVRTVREGQAEPLTSARASLESHLMALAAEEARVNGSIVHMDDFRRRAEAVTGA
ncbi:MAG: Gfo/Idh/MocA family oxidoreductase [Chloroflexi bacterium]|nr:Gfo/Idh/MocA family oxidoreductase [Chloroflexota bacterium]